MKKLSLLCSFAVFLTFLSQAQASESTYAQAVDIETIDAPALTTDLSDSNSEFVEVVRSSESSFNELGVINNVGLQVGPVVSTVSQSATTPVPVASSRTRMMVGANATVGIGGAFYFQPELNYVQRGYDEPFNLGHEKGNFEISLNYLEIPLLAKYRPDMGMKARPYLLAGPSLSFLVSRSAEKRTTDSYGQNTVHSDLFRESSFNAVVLSMVVGGGVDFDLNSTTGLFVGARYAAGLTNTESQGGSNGESVASAKSSAIQLLTGLTFLL